MRIYIQTTPNLTSVPFDYLPKLVGTIHKWIGKNSFHDNISLYSFSWLNGGRKVGDSLEFKYGAKFFISFYDSSVIKKIIKSILDAPDIFCGLRVTEVSLADEKDVAERELFFCASPIFIKRELEDGSLKHYCYDDIAANSLIKETLLSKMKEVGLEDETLDIRFDISYSKKKMKLVHYRGIGNKANICPIIIKAKPETKLFAWNVGIGNCTGIGFGAIY